MKIIALSIWTLGSTNKTSAHLKIRLIKKRNEAINAYGLGFRNWSGIGDWIGLFSDAVFRRICSSNYFELANDFSIDSRSATVALTGHCWVGIWTKTWNVNGDYGWFWTKLIWCEMHRVSDWSNETVGGRIWTICDWSVASGNANPIACIDPMCGWMKKTMSQRKKKSQAFEELSVALQENLSERISRQPLFHRRRRHLPKDRILRDLHHHRPLRRRLLHHRSLWTFERKPAFPIAWLVPLQIQFASVVLHRKLSLLPFLRASSSGAQIHRIRRPMLRDAPCTRQHLDHCIRHHSLK